MRRGPWWRIDTIGRKIADIWHFRGGDTMRSLRRNACIAVTLISLTGMAGAADIRVLSVGAVQNAVRALAADFGTESGHRVVLTFGAPVVVTQKIKDGEVFDAVIVSEPAMDRLDQDGVVNPESRVPLAKTGMGVAVRAGAPLPDLSTSEAVSQESIANGEVEMGLYNVSEIPEGKGLAFAGPVPAPLQITTSYEGALMSDGSEPQAARAFVRFLASPEARAKWLAARLEPLADR